MITEGLQNAAISGMCAETLCIRGDESGLVFLFEHCLLSEAAWRQMMTYATKNCGRW